LVFGWYYSPFCSGVNCECHASVHTSTLLRENNG